MEKVDTNRHWFRHVNRNRNLIIESRSTDESEGLSWWMDMSYLTFPYMMLDKNIWWRLNIQTGLEGKKYRQRNICIVTFLVTQSILPSKTTPVPPGAHSGFAFDGSLRRYPLSDKQTGVEKLFVFAEKFFSIHRRVEKDLIPPVLVKQSCEFLQQFCRGGTRVHGLLVRLSKRDTTV